MPASTLPSQLSERSFRRYEDVLNTIVDKWPLVTIFNPAPLSVETFSCRLRDAKKSLARHHWKTKIDMEKFFRITADITVSIKDGNVCAGPYNNLRKTESQAVLQPQELDGLKEFGGIKLVDPSQDIVDAVLTLHHYRLLLQPTTIKVTNKNHPIFSTLYDIAIDGDAENGWTIF